MKITKSMTKQGIKNSDQAFENFYSTLRPSLKLWDFFVNWDKVFRNTRQIEIHLNLWNYLLGKPNFDEEFRLILKKISYYSSKLLPVHIYSSSKPRSFF